MSFSAKALTAKLEELGYNYCVSVPDSCQKKLLENVEHSEQIELVTASSEDEAVAIYTGLWIGGRKPFLSIQNSGIFACVNALRGLSIEMNIPTIMIVGIYHRDPKKLLSNHDSVSVKNFLPLLFSMDIYYKPFDDLYWLEDINKTLIGPFVLYLESNLDA